MTSRPAERGKKILPLARRSLDGLRRSLASIQGTGIGREIVISGEIQLST